ncbi:hypothetical protein DL93DRAFT_2142175 [Clavulina sp. PMI_390]|nr:hypothetical protein DL93DRAFT_2142175 [Clavulina sp. PMI_390]
MSTSTALSKLEPFLLMAKSAKGAAATKLIESATAAPGVFVFAELIDTPSIQQLAGNEQFKPHLDLLNLFSYGTYEDYKKNPAGFPHLNEAQLTKLKQLSIVSYSSENRILPYRPLLTQLDIPSIRALEDLIIDAIYAELIRGKFDQKNQHFEVSYSLGRDLRPAQLESLLGALRDWSNRTASVLTSLDNKITALDDAEKAKKDNQIAYDKQRQVLVDELVAAQQQAAENKASKGGNPYGAGAGGSRTSGRSAAPPGYGVAMKTPSLFEEEMEVDPPAGAAGKGKKPASSGASSGGSGLLGAMRKRTRGGQ